jgi:hypothetical protein
MLSTYNIDEQRNLPLDADNLQVDETPLILVK